MPAMIKADRVILMKKYIFMILTNGGRSFNVLLGQKKLDYKNRGKK